MTKEIPRMGFSMALPNLLNLNCTHKPSMSGITSKRTTVISRSKKLSWKVFRYSPVSGKMLDHTSKLSGVKMGVSSVEIAVRETDRATFAPETDEIKFEILPPGHAATKIIPNANAGWGRRSKISRKVKTGKSMN